MSHRFPSEDWVAAYQQAINGNEAYAEAATHWNHGAIAMVVKADPDRGLEEDFAVWLDLHQGRCREARTCTVGEAQEAPFCLTAQYERWQEVLNGELDPIKALLMRKLHVDGPLTTLIRYVQAAKELVRSGSLVDTEFLAS